ncbi:hypothetical protein ACSBR2_004412 [Camellia fascicularis]
MATIPIFDGTNYEFWSVKMSTLLLSKNLWYTVHDGYNHEANRENQQNHEALSHIQQGVSDWIRPKIEDATTAKQAWDILSQLNTENYLRQTAANHLIVATLIATVAFTAGFTMPGGYNGNDGPNQGMAILTRKAAFQAFMVTDTIAMSCSILAVITHFDAAITNNRDTLQKQVNKAAYLISSAAGAMVLAFVTGTYVVLAHSSGLAISVCVIGCLPLPFFFATNIMKNFSHASLLMIRSFFGSEPNGRYVFKNTIYYNNISYNYLQIIDTCSF